MTPVERLRKDDYMKIKIGEALHEIKNYSIGERNLLLMFDTPVEGLTEGGQWQLCDDEGNAAMELPIVKELVEVTYHFATMSGTEAALTEEIMIKEAEIIENIREVLTLREELDEKEKAFDELLESVRSGLAAAPVDGEEWDGAKWYRQGDTAQSNGVMYECVKTCQGKEPVVSPLFWTVVTEKEPAVREWADIESGASIAVGDVVTHAGRTYRCIKAHAKSNIRIVTNTDFWEAV